MNGEKKGLLICGTITGRTRRTIGKDSECSVVTYRINDGNANLLVEEWNPTAFYSIGEVVCLPIYVKIYSRNGVSQLNYIVKSYSATMAGEEF